MACAYDEDLNRIVVTGGLTCSSEAINQFPPTTAAARLDSTYCSADKAVHENRAIYFLELGWHDTDLPSGIGRPRVVPDEEYWQRWEAAGGVPHWWKMPLADVNASVPGTSPLALRGGSFSLIPFRPQREMMVVQNTVVWERDAALETAAGSDGVAAADWPTTG